MTEKSSPNDQRWWTGVCMAAVLASFILVGVSAAVESASLVALTFLLLSWGLLGGIINGTGLNLLSRATLWQVVGGVILVILGLGLGANAESATIFSPGLLVYPGMALVLNPVIVKVVHNRRFGDSSEGKSRM